MDRRLLLKHFGQFFVHAGDLGRYGSGLRIVLRVLVELCRFGFKDTAQFVI